MRIVMVKMTFNDSNCEDTAPEDYDPSVDVESILAYGDDFNLEDWEIVSEETVTA